MAGTIHLRASVPPFVPLGADERRCCDLPCHTFEAGSDAQGEPELRGAFFGLDEARNSCV